MSDLQHLADQLAECEGWYCDDDQDGWCKPGVPMCKHPCPVNDLNALAAAWPRERRWCLICEGDGTFTASGPGLEDVSADTEWEARARLHIAVRAAGLKE